MGEMHKGSLHSSLEEERKPIKKTHRVSFGALTDWLDRLGGCARHRANRIELSRRRRGNRNKEIVNTAWGAKENAPGLGSGESRITARVDPDKARKREKRKPEEEPGLISKSD